MRRIIDNDYFIMLGRLILGGVFIYASWYKIIEPGAFAKSIWYYHMVPGSFINLMALILPWIELLVGLALIVGIWFRGAVLLVNGMLVMFIIALTSAIARNLDIDCGCFKAAESATSSAWETLIRDLIYMVFSVPMLFTRSRRWMLVGGKAPTKPATPQSAALSG